jgi:hypothetical protein
MKVLKTYHKFINEELINVVNIKQLEKEQLERPLTLYDVPIGSQLYCGHVEDGDVCQYHFGESEKKVTALWGRQCPDCGTKIGWKVELVTDKTRISTLEYELEPGFYFSGQDEDSEVEDQIKAKGQVVGKDPRVITGGIPKIIDVSGGEGADGESTTPQSADPNNPFVKYKKTSYTGNTKCEWGQVFNTQTGSCEPAPKLLNPTYAIIEAKKLLEQYENVFCKLYFSAMPSSTKPIVIEELKTKIATLLRELKTGDKLRCKDAFRVFYTNLLPRLSQNNIVGQLQSRDGKKWAKELLKFEYFAQVILSL